MARLEYQDLGFTETETGVKVVFQGFFTFTIDSKELQKPGKYKVHPHAIEFDCSQEKAENKMSMLIERGLSRMKSAMGRRGIYIHRGSGIPLIGSQYFGLVDRGTNLIEIRPITGCNQSCIYCSVDEGIKGRKQTDYFVEKDYIVEEFGKLAEYKQTGDIEAHINPQGEPLLYRPLASLIQDIKPFCRRISIDTNGLLLTGEKLRELEDAGLTQVNVSMNAISRDIASTLAGCPYDPQKVINALKKARISVLIAPVIVPGYNEEEAEKIIKLCTENNWRIGLQSYMKYKHGRNPAKPMPFEKFMAQLSEWEKKHGVKLIMGSEDFKVEKTRELPKPFKTGDVVAARYGCPGRMINEVIAVSSDRAIQVREGLNRKMKVRILRSKHNIYSGIRV